MASCGKTGAETIEPEETITIGEMNERQEVETFIRERNKAMCEQDTLALSRNTSLSLMRL